MNPNVIPDHQKKSFLKGMSEDDFRDKVVRPLFIMKGMRRGKDICGVDEDGKDCYLYTDDSVRKNILYAIQTKKGDVKMSRNSADNLLVVLTQLRTALETTIKDAKLHTAIRPDCVLLVVSGEINKHAQEHIVDEVKDPRIRFLDSDDLIPDIDQLMPEFWLGIDAKRLPYLRAFRDALISQSDTIDMTQIGVSSTVAAPITDDTFVQLYLHRYAKKIVTSHGKPHESIDVEEFSVQQLINKPYKLALVIGEAGSGKTTSLRRLAMLLIDEALKSTDDKIVPIFVRSNEVVRSAIRLVDFAAQTTANFTGERVSAFDMDDLVAGSVTLLIDGFDELALPDQRENFALRLMEFHREYPKCRVILASRDTPHLKDLAGLEFVRMRISPINFRQAGKIIERISKGKDLPTHTTQEILRRLDTVHGIDLTPLLVTIFVATTDYARSDIPANITELFKKFTEMMLGRWDQNKGLAQQYQANVKDFLLSRVAFKMHSSGTTTISASEFKEIIASVLDERGLKATTDILFDEIVNRSGLLRVDNEELSFRHMLLQEFFAGRGIPSSEFMRTVLGQHWWMRAIVFYFGERPGDEPALNALPHQLAEMKGVDLFQAAVAVGLAVQACYLTRTEAKSDAMEWVVHSMAASFDEVLEWFGQANPCSDILRVVFFYMYGRDALSARVISDVAQRLFKQMEDVNRGELTEYQERSLFCCVAGLIGIGDAVAAEEFLKKYHPNDLRLLLPIVIGCAYLDKVQAVPSAQKKTAARIADRIRPLIRDLTKDVLREMKGFILEVHSSGIKAIDGHREQEDLEREYCDGNVDVVDS